MDLKALFSSLVDFALTFLEYIYSISLKGKQELGKKIDSLTQTTVRPP